jgi:hypothetical protein
MSAVNNDQNLLQMMSQVSVWHFYRARDYYFEQHNPKMVERIQFDIERASHLLSTYTTGASQIEAARITAQSTIKHGEHVRRGLESLGQSVQHGLTALGEHVENSGANLGRALQQSSAAISSNVTNAMYTIASSKSRGRSLDRRMSEVGQLISTTAREVPEGFFRPVQELGAKFALGAVGNAAINADITSDPAVINLAESVIPEAKKSEESLRRLEEPSIKLTGTLLDTLVTKGFSKVIEQIEEADSVRNGVHHR